MMQRVAIVPDGLNPAHVKTARKLLDLAREFARDDLIFLFIFQTHSIFLIHTYLIHRFSQSVRAYWAPTLGLTAQYHRGQRLVDR